MPTAQTKKQFRYLMSKSSPLSESQKKKMVEERREGKIRFKKGR